jgi:hypothetical protein
VLLTVVLLLELDRRDVAERSVQARVVEPVDPGPGLDLEVLGRAPGPVRADASSF